jgi:hypothetical protein
MNCSMETIFLSYFLVLDALGALYTPTSSEVIFLHALLVALCLLHFIILQFHIV